MRFLTLSFLLGAVLAMSGVCFARNAPKPDCVSFAEASQHVGTAQCITGTVQHVEDGRNGAKLLNFCKNKTCPFTAVVFPTDLKKMGDIRQLEGRQIEIKGTVQDYDAPKSSCAVPYNCWATPPLYYSRGCPPTTTSSERATAAPEGSAVPRPPKRRLPSRALRLQLKTQESRSSFGLVSRVFGKGTTLVVP
jgi:hypothetical protein